MIILQNAREQKPKIDTTHFILLFVLTTDSTKLNTELKSSNELSTNNVNNIYIASVSSLRRSLRDGLNYNPTGARQRIGEFAIGLIFYET